MSQPGARPPTAQEYQRFRPLLLSALGLLARRGYLIAPADGLELIHDFFLEAWSGLGARYDETRGAFSTYLFGAFVRFARPRIVRHMRLQESTLPLGDLDAADEEALGEAADEGRAVDLALVRGALASLPPRDRVLLQARIGSGRSEREVARHLGLSRYRLRERCAEALARLAAAAGEPGVIDRRDWPLVRALWAEARSLREAAAALGLTLHQARQARQRILGLLALCIPEGAPEAPPRSPPSSSPSSPRRRSMVQDLCALWSRLVADPRSPAAVAGVRERTGELLDHVEACEGCAHAGPPGSGLRGESPRETAHDLAALYLALGVAEGELDGEDARLCEGMLQADARDEAQVQAAVEEVLLPGLSARARSLYHDLPAEVTPRLVFLATEAVSMLVRRLARLHCLFAQRLELTPTGALEVDGVEMVSAGAMAREIGRFTHASEASAFRLAAWIPCAAWSQPHLFRGLDAERVSLMQDRVRVIVIAGAEVEDLAERWRPSLLVDSGPELATLPGPPGGDLRGESRRMVVAPRARPLKGRARSAAKEVAGVEAGDRSRRHRR